MSNLTALPDELLEEIFTYLSTDLHQLCELTTLSRRIHHLIQPLVFRHVRISVHSPHGQIPRQLEITRQLELFGRSLLENPQLVSETRSIDLQWHSSNPHVNHLVSTVLGKLVKIDSLRLRLPSSAFMVWPAFLSANPMSELRVLTMHGCGLSIEQIVRFMQLPRLQSISAHWYEALPRQPTTPGCRQVSLQRLQLEGYGLPPQVLRELLAWPRALRKLVCLDSDHKLKESLWALSPTDMLYPALVAPLLLPTKQSLVKLCFGLQVWPDGSRVDLSDFAVLEILKVPAACFFSTREPSPARDGLCRLLPPSLQQLTIYFELSWYLLDPGDVKADSNSRDLENVAKWKYAWLSELVDCKSTSLPALRSISLWERFRDPRRHRFEQLSWAPPKMLRHSLDKAGVGLRVLLRRPLHHQ